LVVLCVRGLAHASRSASSVGSRIRVRDLLPKRRLPPGINSEEFTSHYGISNDLLEELNDLIELRNEIIHPAHATCGSSDNWPAYLSKVKQKGILNSTRDASGDYSTLAQMASHRLFQWAVSLTRRLYERVIESDRDRAVVFRPFPASFDPPWFEPGRSENSQIRHTQGHVWIAPEAKSRCRAWDS
jgi:hypothetical protein